MFKDIFPLKIYEAFYPNFESIKESLLNEVMSKFDIDGDEHRNHRLFSPTALTTTGSKPSSIKQLHQQLSHKELIDWINQQVKIYWDGLGYDPIFNPKIFHMWANATGKKENVMHHNHSPFEIAGVFYINATPEMGGLALIHPNEMVLGRLPYYQKRESHQGRYFFDHMIEPMPGKLILFPAWLYHKTQPNLTDELRVVMAFSSGGMPDMLGMMEDLKVHFQKQHTQ